MSVNLVRSRKADSRNGCYFFTPAQAASLLENAAKNRPLKEYVAQQIADEILAGAWKVNGESIVFDEKGRVVDGQHRLRSCVLSNKTIEAYCVFGIPSKYFASFDQGRGRGGSDIAALMDFRNANCIAACARLVIEFTDETIAKGGTGKMPNERLRAYMDRNREALTRAVDAVLKVQGGIRKLIPLSHAAFVYYMNASSHGEKALEFLEKLSTGAGLHKGDAVLLFRQRMTDLIGEKHVLRQTDKLALIIKTWNAFLGNKSLGVLRWKSDVEAFPRFD